MGGALLIGGFAHGRVCGLRRWRGAISVSMVSGGPEAFELDDPRVAAQLLSRAFGTWQTYHLLDQLGPSSAGLRAYYCRANLPPPFARFIQALLAGPADPDSDSVRWGALEELLRSSADDHDRSLGPGGDLTSAFTLNSRHRE